MGVVLAVKVEAVESRNMRNDCALNRSQKRCFMLFYRFYLYTLAVVLNCLLVILTVEFQRPKRANFHFMHLL